MTKRNVSKTKLMISKLMARNIWPLVQNRNEEEWALAHSDEWRFLWAGWIFATRRSLFVCGFVQGLSLYSSGTDGPIRTRQTPKMRQSAGTTMAFVTWRHVPRGTCHVPPREPLAKPYRKDQIFERNIAETRNFQGRCTRWDTRAM